MLLKTGVNTNMKDIHGHTSLHMASSAGNDVIVSALLRHKAQPNATNMKQQTPLHFALMNGHKGTGLILLQHGSDPTLLDAFDKTGDDYLKEFEIREQQSDSLENSLTSYHSNPATESKSKPRQESPDRRKGILKTNLTFLTSIEDEEQDNGESGEETGAQISVIAPDAELKNVQSKYSIDYDTLNNNFDPVVDVNSIDFVIHQTDEEYSQRVEEAGTSNDSLAPSKTRFPHEKKVVLFNKGYVKSNSNRSPTNHVHFEEEIQDDINNSVEDSDETIFNGKFNGIKLDEHNDNCDEVNYASDDGDADDNGNHYQEGHTETSKQTSMSGKQSKKHNHQHHHQSSSPHHHKIHHMHHGKKPISKSKKATLTTATTVTPTNAKSNKGRLTENRQHHHAIGSNKNNNNNEKKHNVHTRSHYQRKRKADMIQME